VRLDLDPSLGAVTTDSERLRVALVNLIVNARHAVEAQGREAAVAAASLEGVHAAWPPESRSNIPAAIAESTGPQVSVSTRAAGDRVTIVVADTGVGIDQADLPRVFDPYFTTKRGGTGLGLPIAKNIVEGLGGTIAVSSSQGQGTEIRIELPMQGAVLNS